jgi:hypothetical protein
MHDLKGPILKSICGVLLAAVVVSSFVFAPEGPVPKEWSCETALLHMLVAILCLSFLLLKSVGENVIANHGAAGLIGGIVVGWIFFGQLKAGFILVLLSALPGAVIGLAIGLARWLVAGAPPRTDGNVEADVGEEKECQL